jgi:ubiquinone biosynthesis monooxygenase Coq7
VQCLGQKRLMVADPAITPVAGTARVPNVGLEGVRRAPGDDLPRWVFADLRTDHAGEVGAVCIYRGVLRVARDPRLRAFAQHHLATEQKHLRTIESWLPAAHHSRLLPVWRLAGFLTGALPALIGPRAVYATIEAVETFVDHHYDQQVRALSSQPELQTLRQALLECQADEVAHRDEAAAARGPLKTGKLLRAWCVLVGAGSHAAVSVIRYI